MLEKQIDYKGTPLFYTIMGEGDAVVLLHGFGEDATVWKEQYAALQGYKIILPALPGSGKSAITQDMSMEGLAEGIRAVVKAEGIQSFVLLGHSMGGYITLAYAAAYPGELAGLGLIHSTAFADTKEKAETRRKGIDFIKRNGGEAFLRTTIPNLYASTTKDKNPELIEQHLAGAKRFDNAALILYYESITKRPDRTPVLETAEIPVLFVAGRWDAAVPLDDVLKQARLPQVSYIHILEKSGHIGMTEEPEEMNKAIREFTDDCYKHRIK